jgi:hypothetical protein
VHQKPKNYLNILVNILNHPLLNILLVVTVTLLIAIRAVPADPSPPAETSLLAALILNIAKFTEWHGAETGLNSKGSQEDAPSGLQNAVKLRFAVLDNADLFQELSTFARGKKVRNHEIQVVPITTTDLTPKAGNIVILIPKNNNTLDSTFLDKLVGCECLTITYKKGMIHEGSIVNFFIKENKFNFEINLSKAKLEQIELSSQFLKLGEVVE